MALKPVFGGFSNPEPGIHIARIKALTWDVWKDDKDNVKGRQVRVEFSIEGGSSDGMTISDWFHTPTKGDFSLSKLLGVMVKAGVVKETDEVSAEDFRTEENEKRVKSKLEERMIGLDIRADRKDKERIRVFAYLTVKEAQIQQKGNGKTSTESKPAEPTDKKTSAWT